MLKLLSKLHSLLACAILLATAGSSIAKDVVHESDAQECDGALTQEEEPTDSRPGIYPFVNFSTADINVLPEVMIYQNALEMATPSDNEWKLYSERLNKCLNVEWWTKNCRLSGQARFHAILTKDGHILGLSETGKDNAPNLAQDASTFLMTLDGSRFLKFPPATAVPVVHLNIIFVGVPIQASTSRKQRQNNPSQQKAP